MTTATDPVKTEPQGTAPAGEKLQVRGDETPWTKDELAAVKSELEGDVERLNAELRGVENEIAELIDDSGDGAGDDQADVGTKSFEREHEFTLAQNSQGMLEQSQHALERLADGTYGVCESCEKPIGKLRLQAFPRATLCMQCKQKQERR
ncbi:MAG: TraR/DksA C4-type zinc finger protein [Allobranchiibius sp.]